MCGLGGYVGISADHRAAFVQALGIGIDSRGGDASGYLAVSRSSGNLVHAKRVGTWTHSKNKFRRKAAMGDMAIMHARWATCGSKTAQDQAHPFEIKRDGQTKLYGAHNGCIWNAKESAKVNGRVFSVDSKELFELMADGDVDGIQELDGYGVITWYVPGTNYINLVRLSDHSEICVVSLKSGGIAWASTWSILSDALEFAELEADSEISVPEIGRIYQLRDRGVFRSDVDGIKFESKGLEEAPESWEVKLIASWEAEEEEKENLYWELMNAKDGDDDDRDVPPMFDSKLQTSWERDMERDIEIEDETAGPYPSIAAMYR